MMPGETIGGGASPVCDGCGTAFRFEAMRTPAGWYVGTRCHTADCPYRGQPNSRESHYYPSLAALTEAMRSDTVHWRT